MTEIGSGNEVDATFRQEPEPIAEHGSDLVLREDTEKKLSDPENNKPGKNIIEIGSPEFRAAIVNDVDSAITTDDDGVTRSARILAEIHKFDEDLITGETEEPFVLIIGDGLANSRPATTDAGIERPGETVGDGVLNGKVYKLRKGDKVRVPKGAAHVHGTESRKDGAIVNAAATFVKRNEAPRS